MSDLITKADVDAVFDDKDRPEQVSVWCASWSGVEVAWLSGLMGPVQGWLALGGQNPGLIVVEFGPVSLPDGDRGKTWVLEGELFCADPGVSLRLRAQTPDTLSVHAVAEQDLNGWDGRPKTPTMVAGAWGGEAMWATDKTALGRYRPHEHRSKGRRVLRYRTYWHVPDDGAVAPVMTVFRGF